MIESENPVLDFMYAMALRARELANQKMYDLRLSAGYDCDTNNQCQERNRGKSRGELIEEILTEEFELDAKHLDGSPTI